jgi:hypothetical protein
VVVGGVVVAGVVVAGVVVAGVVVAGVVVAGVVVAGVVVVGVEEGDKNKYRRNMLMSMYKIVLSSFIYILTYNYNYKYHLKKARTYHKPKCTRTMLYLPKDVLLPELQWHIMKMFFSHHILPELQTKFDSPHHDGYPVFRRFATHERTAVAAFDNHINILDRRIKKEEDQMAKSGDGLVFSTTLVRLRNARRIWMTRKLII